MLVLWYPDLCTYVGGALKVVQGKSFFKNKIKQLSLIRNPQKLTNAWFPSDDLTAVYLYTNQNFNVSVQGN